MGKRTAVGYNACYRPSLWLRRSPRKQDPRYSCGSSPGQRAQAGLARAPFSKPSWNTGSQQPYNRQLLKKYNITCWEGVAFD